MRDSRGVVDRRSWGLLQLFSRLHLQNSDGGGKYLLTYFACINKPNKGAGFAALQNRGLMIPSLFQRKAHNRAMTRAGVQILTGNATTVS